LHGNDSIAGKNWKEQKMNLEQFYKKAVKIGIQNDLRDKGEIKKVLQEEKKKFDKLEKKDQEYFDKDKLFNPYSDSRILFGDLNTNIKKVIVGIDMETGEILLTYLLNRDKSAEIDLIVAHHPEGTALAQLYDVMKLQADLLAQAGISISIAEQLMDKRISEIERRLLPVNHNRAVDTARILGIPFICIHTPADNCVTHFLTQTFKKEKPYKLKDIMDILKGIPEYKTQNLLQVAPKIVSGSEDSRCGKIFIDMTGGTSGSKEIFDKFANSGVSTLVGMHIGEDYLEKAKKANLNVIIAGHISSDSLGFNLLFDEIEKEQRLEFIGASGFERNRRKK